MSADPPIRVRDAVETDRRWVERVLLDRWGSTSVISAGRRHEAADLPAKLARRGDADVGLATLHVADGACELVTLDALTPRQGIGSALLKAVIDESAGRGCRRLWLITTNDNLDALRFYQRRGLRLVAVHAGAVDRARRLKPSIPHIGHFGIAIRDEIELQLALTSGADIPDPAR